MTATKTHTNEAQERDALEVISALRRESDSQLIAFLSSDDPRAQAIKGVTPEIAAYPYGKEARAFFGKDGLSRFFDVVNIYKGADDQAKKQAEALTEGAIQNLSQVMDRIPRDIDSVIEAIDGGQWKTLDGDTWPRDRYQLADITEYLPLELLENSHKIASSDIRNHVIAERGKMTNILDMEIFVENDAPSHLIAVPIERTEDDNEIVLPYGSLVHRDLAFGFICNLDAAGYTDALKELFSEPLEVAAELIPLAQVQETEQLVNHGLIAKTLEGITAIAHGEPEYTLKPKGGKSKEIYRLRASEKTCTDFIKAGGNDELLLKVIETVIQIISDPQAEKYILGGLLGVTTNTITQELLRTQGGTIEARKKQTARQLVNAALLAATEMRIIATDPTGKELQNTFTPYKAEYRKEYRYKKHTYKDVWLFDINAETMNSYAEERGYTYRYPLLNMDRPLTMAETWIDRYLKDALNELRHKLYKKDGSKKPQKTATIKRSWSDLFEKEASDPTRELSSKQKRKLVKDFETILTVLADMDAHGILREGRPLSITAYSERNASRGRGRGEWENLVIEATTSYHVPRIDLS